MILIGQYDSPFVRRVAVSLRVLGMDYEHDTRSIFGDFDALRAINPVGRIPALVLDDGEVLIDSSAILDHIDQAAGPARALTPADGKARREALRRMALATGVVEKAGATVYESQIRPAALRWPDWIARCRTQAEGALAALEALDWSAPALGQPQITAACVMGWLRIADPTFRPAGRYPRLEALAARCEARPEFAATRPADYQIPRAG